MLTYDNIDGLLRKYKRDLDNMAFEYGEKGYDNPKSGILFANWNDVPKHIIKGLERRGFELEWSDEWIIADETSKAYRTSPTSYGWQPYYWLRDDCEVIGGDEIENDANIRESYIEHLTNNPRVCNFFNIDLVEYGFEEMDQTFENGFFPGMNADPKKIIKQFEDEFDVIFDARGGSSQFYLSFTLWRKPKVKED